MLRLLNSVANVYRLPLLQTSLTCSPHNFSWPVASFATRMLLGAIFLLLQATVKWLAILQNWMRWTQLLFSKLGCNRPELTRWEKAVWVLQTLPSLWEQISSPWIYSFFCPWACLKDLQSSNQTHQWISSRNLQTQKIAECLWMILGVTILLQS